VQGRFCKFKVILKRSGQKKMAAKHRFSAPRSREISFFATIQSHAKPKKNRETRLHE
jgi:hypothetical protein